MAFFTSGVDMLQKLVVGLGAALVVVGLSWHKKTMMLAASQPPSI